mgnify:FL=1
MPYDGNKRRLERKSVSLKAELTLDSQSFPCDAHNLSTGGSKIEVAQILERDQSVELKVGSSSSIKGRIAWTQTPYYGLRFEDDSEDVANIIMGIATYGAD